MIVAITAAVRALALEAIAAAGILPDDVAWENIGARTGGPFEPPPNRPWASETLRVGPLTPNADGLRGLDQADPFYQLTLQVPEVSGTTVLDQMTAAVLLTFRPRREVEVRDPTGRRALWLRVDSAEPGPVAVGVVDGWAARPMRIGLHALALADHRATDPALAVSLT